MTSLFGKVYRLPVHPDGFISWYYILADCKREHWNAARTIWRYAIGV